MAFRDKFAKMPEAKKAIVRKIVNMPPKDRERFLELEAMRRGIDRKTGGPRESASSPSVRPPRA